MLKRLLASVVALLMLAGLATAPAVAAPGSGGCSVTDPTCWVGVEDGEEGSEGPVVGDPVEFTPGPSYCFHNGREIDCQTEDGWWSAGLKCYVSYTDPQIDFMGEGVGAWYRCKKLPEDDCSPGCQEPYIYNWWSQTIPPGIERYSPIQAANALVSTFRLQPIEIGMAPERKVHADDPPGTDPYRRTWVGVPVWLWAAEPDPLNFGPYEETATLGGVTVTARAEVSGVVWTSSDGQRDVCGTGTPFDLDANRDRPAVESPDCGLRFETTGVHTITATTTWAVSWSGGGTEGTFASVTTSTSDTVQVGELQSVNTVPRP